MSDEKPQMIDQVNGSPPTKEQIALAFNAAMQQYAQGLAEKLRQVGELNPFELLMQSNITAMRLNTLLNYLQQCTETEEAFSMTEYDCRVVGNLQQMAAAIAQPQILVPGTTPRRQ